MVYVQRDHYKQLENSISDICEDGDKRNENVKMPTVQ
jgi:hypothetical protein